MTNDFQPRPNTNSDKKTVVDLDDTLLLNTFFSRLLQGLSTRLHRWSFRFQKRNDAIAKLIPQSAIILTTRSKESFGAETIGHLQRLGINYSELIMYPEQQIKDFWKRKNIEQISPDDWYDDREEQISTAENPFVPQH